AVRLRQLASAASYCTTRPSVQSAATLLLHAAIHDHVQTGICGPLRGSLIDHAFLQPERAHALVDAGFHDFGYVFGAAENVHQINGADPSQVLHSMFTQHDVLVRVDGHDLVTVALQGFRHLMRRAIGAG